MIGLARLALRRPYTSAIAAMLIVLMGALSVTRMIVDIFPVIDIPVVLVVWNYNGLTTEDMERRVVFITERAATVPGQIHGNRAMPRVGEPVQVLAPHGPVGHSGVKQHHRFAQSPLVRRQGSGDVRTTGRDMGDAGDRGRGNETNQARHRHPATCSAQRD